MKECPFCSREGILFRNELAHVREDKFPVSPGHLLIIPDRHISDYFEITWEEKMAMNALLEEARRHLDSHHRPDGYNIGVNIGAFAGQTILHVHIHLIPRYKGDMPDPRGGVRGVIPDKQSY